MQLASRAEGDGLTPGVAGRDDEGLAVLPGDNNGSVGWRRLDVVGVRITSAGLLGVLVRRGKLRRNICSEGGRTGRASLPRVGSFDVGGALLDRVLGCTDRVLKRGGGSSHVASGAHVGGRGS